MTNQIEKLEHSEKREARYYPFCGCFYGPADRFGNYFWGALLVITGGIWLLQNVGVLSGDLLDVLWPLLIIGFGASILGWALYGRSRGTDYK